MKEYTHLKQKPIYWQRALYTPVFPLGEDGRRATLSPKHIEKTRKAACEGMVLLKNNGILPLKKGQRIAVFGIGQADYQRGGTGAGIVRVPFEKTLLDGLREKDEAGDVELFRPLADFYQTGLLDQRENAMVNGYDVPQTASYSNPHKVGDLTFFIGRADDPEIPADLLAQAKEFTDTAIVTVSRTSGEFYDRTPGPGEFALTDAEKATIETVKKNFRHVIAVINSGGQIEAGWTEDPAIGAVLLMMTPGMMGGVAAADLLCGRENPSGRLVDTWARNYEDYPTSGLFLQDDYYVNYENDIFVGYRYFETIPGAAEKVVYPFGFGLSYTTFERLILSAGEKDGDITVQVLVKNTGDVAGREVVQAYYGAPQGKLGKAAKSLAAFRKTKLLQPGETEAVALTFSVSSMASYDENGVYCKSAYLLEQGDYPVYVGASVRDVEVAFTYHVAEEYRVTEQLTARCPVIALPRRLKADGTYEQLPYGVLKRPEYPVYQSVGEKVKADMSGETVASSTKASAANKLEDVLEGRITLDQFIAGLGMDELTALSHGIPSTGICCTGGFGGISALGIPPIMTSDSPAGLRTRPWSGFTATAFPSAVTMASTWDPDLVEDEGSAIALEIKENNMYAWLGPALNIHFDPLGGRNFEYFSEDPLISGKMAAAAVRGAQSQRISGCPKHFAANSKDTNRRDSDSRMTERALREIYLKGFEICVKESAPRTVMSSYNYINGIRASESPDLLTYILRGEWGFDGFVMTDWSGHGRHAIEMMAGNDLKMPSGDPRMVKSFLRDQCMKKGSAENCIRNILRVILWYEGWEG